MSVEEQNLIHADRAYDMSGTRLVDSSQVKFLLGSDEIMLKFTAAVLRCDIGSKGELVPIIYNVPQRQEVDGVEKIVMVQVQLPPLMNELGVKDMRSYLDSYLNPNMYLGETNIEIICEMVKETMMAVIETLCANYMEYGIDEDTSFDQILNIMLIYTFAAASRSKDGVTNTLLTKTSSSIQHEVSKIDSQDEKKGFFNWRGK